MRETNFRIYKFHETRNYKYVLVYCDSVDCPVNAANEMAHNYMEGLRRLYGAEVSYTHAATQLVAQFSFKNDTDAVNFWNFLLAVRGLVMSNR
jgi:hypothetical protein